jgi:hypothetical protein
MRRTNHTIVLVCEGYGDCQFASLVRDLYLPRDCGTALQIKNARGFGGRHALRMAQELKMQAAHDSYGVMIDTDSHWGEQERIAASSARIIAVENDPSLEAMLLRIARREVARTTAENKRIFEEAFGGPANRDGIIRRNFDRSKIDSARSAVGSLDLLLRLLRCP